MCRTATAVALRHGGGLKDVPATTIHALCSEFENSGQQTRLELSSTDDRTTPVLAEPVPAPPQPRRGAKTSNLYDSGFRRNNQPKNRSVPLGARTAPI